MSDCVKCDGRTEEGEGNGNVMRNLEQYTYLLVLKYLYLVCLTRSVSSISFHFRLSSLLFFNCLKPAFCRKTRALAPADPTVMGSPARRAAPLSVLQEEEGNGNTQKDNPRNYLCICTALGKHRHRHPLTPTPLRHLPSPLADRLARICRAVPWPLSSAIPK